MDNRSRTVFKLYPSSLFMQSTALLYLVAMIVVIIYFNQIMFSAGLALMLLLLSIREINQCKQAKSELPIVIVLKDDSGELVIDKNGRNQNYLKFNLYDNRWFAILRVLNEKGSDQILITHDRFKHPMEYSDFRYLLLTLENRQHGT
jgi:hypothetical protein